MKTRRHHNNYGKATIENERTVEQVRRMAERLHIPFSYLRKGKCHSDESARWQKQSFEGINTFRR